MPISKKVAELSARLSAKPDESAKPETETTSPRDVGEVIKVKTEKTKTKKPEATEAAAAAAKPAAKKEVTVTDDAQKEDENGWFSFLKIFGF